MSDNNLPPRFVPLTQPGQDSPVFFVDTQAPLVDLHACAELRVSLATRFLDAMVNMQPTHADERDLSTIASTAPLLMLEACDVHRVIERRLWQADVEAVGRLA